MLTRTRKKHWPSRCLSVDIKKNTADEKNRVFRLISCLINRATCRCEAKSDPVKNHVKRRHRTTMTKTILYLTLSRCPWSLVNFSCHLSAWRLLAKKTAIKKMLLIELKLYVISGSARTALLYFLSSPYHTDIRLTEWLSDWVTGHHQLDGRTHSQNGAAEKCLNQLKWISGRMLPGRRQIDEKQGVEWRRSRRKHFTFPRNMPAIVSMCILQLKFIYFLLIMVITGGKE